MKESSYNRQLLKDYLFSALSAEETERLDELSFTDDRFVQELRAVEDDLVDAYASGELEGKLRVQFETRYLSSPLRREKVALARALHDCGRETQKLVRQQPNQLSAWRTFFSPSLSSRAWQWTFASALLILIGLSAWLVFQNRKVMQVPQHGEIAQRDAGSKGLAGTTPTQEPQPTSTQPTAEAISGETKKPETRVPVEVASIVLAPQIRGGTEVPTVSVKSATSYVAVELDLEPNEYSVYRVELLQHTTGKTLWRAANSRSHEHEGDQTIKVRLPATLLRSELYILQVSGLSPKGTSELISYYRFRVVKSPKK
ncbi:MAG TPA: hypothetical protein VL866_07270 [Pyrinomonadaceae bacterium]|nr:hypothetical protein [Pyrinomonadaceae bacterium]